MKSKNVVKTRKITLILDGTPDEKKEMKSYMFNLFKDMTRIGNETIRKYIVDEFNIQEIQEKHNLTSKDRGKAIKIFSELSKIKDPGNSAYHSITGKYPFINTRIINILTNSLWKTMEKNFFDVLIGKMSIPSYRTTNFPIPVEISIKKEEKYYSFNLPMSIPGNKNFTTPKFNLFLGKDRSNNGVIIERILDKTYQLKCSTIQLTKDNDFVLNLVFEHPIIVNETIDPNKIMGVDIGINRPVSFYITGEKYQPKQIDIGLKIQHERIVLQNKRKSLQSSNKYSRGGHGRNRKNQSLKLHREKETNWSTLMNHKISSELKKIAINYNVGLIKMENLTGITKNKKTYFLKSWRFDQLQQFIIYKVNQVGIKTEWVDPKNTSITCSTCGTTDPENRNDVDKTIFKCKNFACEDFEKVKDADVNASYNITHSVSLDVKKNTKKGRIQAAINKKNNLDNNI